MCVSPKRDNGPFHKGPGPSATSVVRLHARCPRKRPKSLCPLAFVLCLLSFIRLLQSLPIFLSTQLISRDWNGLNPLFGSLFKKWAVVHFHLYNWTNTLCFVFPAIAISLYPTLPTLPYPTLLSPFPSPALTTRNLFICLNQSWLCVLFVFPPHLKHLENVFKSSWWHMGERSGLGQAHFDCCGPLACYPEQQI